MNRTTVLVVEDDVRLAGAIAEQLREEDYDAFTASGVAEAMRMLASHDPDAVLVDVMLPDGSGFELCRRIRAGGEGWDASAGVLVLSARVAEVDVLRAFDRGADDFLRKPFSMPELVVRLRALLARRRKTMRGRLRLGLLDVDRAARLASYGGQPLELSAKEYDLLVELASEPGAVRTKRELLVRVWGCPPGLRTRTVDSHASRLRRKLVEAGAPGDPVVNSWGHGYRLELSGA